MRRQHPPREWRPALAATGTRPVHLPGRPTQRPGPAEALGPSLPLRRLLAQRAAPHAAPSGLFLTHGVHCPVWLGLLQGLKHHDPASETWGPAPGGRGSWSPASFTCSGRCCWLTCPAFCMQDARSLSKDVTDTRRCLRSSLKGQPVALLGPVKCRLILTKNNFSESLPYSAILSLCTHMCPCHPQGNPLVLVSPTGFLSLEIPGPPSQHCKALQIQTQQLKFETATVTTPNTQSQQPKSWLRHALMSRCVEFQTTDYED